MSRMHAWGFLFSYTPMMPPTHLYAVCVSSQRGDGLHQSKFKLRIPVWDDSNSMRSPPLAIPYVPPHSPPHLTRIPFRPRSPRVITHSTFITTAPHLCPPSFPTHILFPHDPKQPVQSISGFDNSHIGPLLPTPTQGAREGVCCRRDAMP